MAVVISSQGTYRENLEETLSFFHTVMMQAVSNLGSPHPRQSWHTVSGHSRGQHNPALPLQWPMLVRFGCEVSGNPSPSWCHPSLGKPSWSQPQQLDIDAYKLSQLVTLWIISLMQRRPHYNGHMLIQIIIIKDINLSTILASGTYWTHT